MPLWPYTTEKTMKKKNCKNLFYLSKKTDLQHLKSMKTHSLATYTSLDKASRIEKRNLKLRKEISKPSCSSVMTIQKISDIPLGDSCNSDLDVASFTELPKKRLHKRVVKTGVSLFYLLTFLKTTC